LADKELVEDYLNFMRLRSGLRARPVEASKAVMLPPGSLTPNGKWEFYFKRGTYNKGSLMVLIIVSSLLRPGTGYLYQHPEFAEKLRSRMKASLWHKQCALTRTRVDNLLRKIKAMKKNNDQENFDFGRDPKELISWILDLDRPLLLLNKMLKEMWVDLLPDTASASERARQYRNILLFALLCANPLRIRMFSIMEFEKNLFRKDDGSWRLRFRKGAFKNRRGLKSEYEVGVAKELWPMLDRYKEEFHPVLVGSTGSRYVFTGVGCRGRGGRKQGAPLSAESLSHIVKQLTGLYVSGGLGFGPHSFRHIVATDIIKKDPRIGFFLAARALHDKLETVENEYIHLKTSEFFEPVNTHFAEAWNQVFEFPLAA
jgi:integrase